MLPLPCDMEIVLLVQKVKQTPFHSKCHVANSVKLAPCHISLDLFLAWPISNFLNSDGISAFLINFHRCISLLSKWSLGILCLVRFLTYTPYARYCSLGRMLPSTFTTLRQRTWTNKAQWSQAIRRIYVLYSLTTSYCPSYLEIFF